MIENIELSNDMVSHLKGRGMIIAAPASGSGKTTITLGLLRAMARQNINISSAKAGPDYIDPQFHTNASGQECVNLDPWAMRADYLQHLAQRLASNGPLLVEGMMGLYDGAMDGSGSVADLAELTGLPIVLVVDAAKQSHSIAALVEGFINHRKDIEIAGVILNKVGSSRHEAMLRAALEKSGVTVFGAVLRNKSLAMPERHLGLVQASERQDLDDFINHAADIVENSLDMDLLLNAFSPLKQTDIQSITKLLPLGQKIAVARDRAFAFSYPHIINGWREQGAEISFFSPLNDEAPSQDADAIYLPGGYPELHAGQLAASEKFMAGLSNHAQKNTLIYGECGGYMVLGDGLIDKSGQRHKMAGLLPLTTSYEQPKLHLGYRLAIPVDDFPMVEANAGMRAHEFHYSSVEGIEKGKHLFKICDAMGNNTTMMGNRRSNVMGSFIHLIDIWK